MSKLYKCAEDCGSIEETDDNNTKIPTCCGAPMVEISEEELSGCGGCCHCCHGCGDEECAEEEGAEK